MQTWHQILASLTFTKATVGIAKDLSRQPYMPSVQVVGTTSAPVVPVFADFLTTEGEEKLKSDRRRLTGRLMDELTSAVSAWRLAGPGRNGA